MADRTEKSEVEIICEILLRHGVEFLVIGGQAEVLYGSSRVTLDVDVCYRRSGENLARLASALLELKPTLRGAPPDLQFRLDAQSLALGNNFTFITTAGDFDLLGYVEPIGGYEQLSSNATAFQAGEMAIRAIGLDDLIKIKEYLRRPKDQAALHQLYALRREIK